jgi:mannose-6-phosphate isomerase-like protein (cupin superfamily)
MLCVIIRGADVATLDFHGLRIADYTAREGSMSSSLARIEVEPGARHGGSWSTRSDKYYYLLSGRLRVETDGAADELSPGDAWIVECGRRFSYENTSDEPAMLLLLHTPSFQLEAERFVD